MSEGGRGKGEGMAPVIACRGLRKSFYQGKVEVPVLQGVDLDVAAGERDLGPGHRSVDDGDMSHSVQLLAQGAGRLGGAGRGRRPWPERRRFRGR